MAQSDYQLSDQSGQSYRQEHNTINESIATQNSGTSAPSTTFSNMVWADTTNNVIKRRDDGNSNWNIVDTLDIDNRIITVTSDYTILLKDFSKLILVDASSNDVTLTLPASSSAGEGFFVNIKRSDNSSNSVKIDGNSSETVDSLTTVSLSYRHDFARPMCDGSNWRLANSRMQRTKVVDEIILPIEYGRTFNSGTYTRMFDYETNPITRWPTDILGDYDVYLEYALTGSAGGNVQHAIRFIDSGSNVRFDSGDITVGNQAGNEMTWGMIDVKSGNSTNWDPTTELLSGINGNQSWEVQIRADISSGSYSYHKMSLLLVEPGY